MARIFSGIQPTGVPHLGNYLGAIVNWVSLQQQHKCVFCLVDMHAITVWQDPQLFRKQTLMQTAILLACGIDSEQHILFNQSAVPSHAKLAWIFNCVTRMGWLNRMTQFKDKAGKKGAVSSSGLYVYPNLMAADILAYKATLVPVGEDQQQHLELTNDIAQKFNHDYEVDFFPTVKALIPVQSARIMSLRDGTRKMSKSDPSSQSRIELTDDSDTIRMKIKRAKTDSFPIPSSIDDMRDRPEACNLVTTLAAVTGKSVMDILTNMGGGGFDLLKDALATALVELIEPIRFKALEFYKDEAALLDVLRKGAGKATAIAEPIVRNAENIVGFLR